MAKKYLSFLGMALLPFLAACGGESDGGGGGEITEAAAATTMAGVGFVTGSDGYGARAAMMAALTETETRDLSGTGECGGGGTFTTDGEITVTTTTSDEPLEGSDILSSSTSGSYSQTYTNCRSVVIQSVLDGNCTFTITVNGTLNIVGEGMSDATTTTSTDNITGTNLEVVFEPGASFAGDSFILDLSITRTISITGSGPTATTSGTVTIDGVDVDIEEASELFESLSTNSACLFG